MFELLIVIVLIAACLLIGFAITAIVDVLWRAWLWLILPKKKKVAEPITGPSSIFIAPNRQLPLIEPLDGEAVSVEQIVMSDHFQSWMAEASDDTNDRYIDAPRHVRAYGDPFSLRSQSALGGLSSDSD